MNKNNTKKALDPIGESLEIDNSIVSVDVNSEIISNENDHSSLSSSELDEIHKDYEYTRGNLYSLVQKGQEAINGILELAQESDSPRAYEVAGQLIKNVADTTDKLIDLQKKMKDLKDNTVKGPTNVTNALFIGSTTELSKILKNQDINHK
jgi:hypothetical protein